MKKKLILRFLACSLLFFGSSNGARGATFNWIGGHGNSFTQANNWYEGSVPGSGDVAQIGVTYAPTVNTPVVTAAGTTGIASLVVGTNYSNSGSNPIGISVSAGSTLAVSGDITFEVNVLISASSNYYISGAGTITATNMYIKANTLNLGLSLLFDQQVNCSINSLVLSGNLSLSSLNIAILLSQVAYFNLTAGTTEIDGNITTINNGFLGLYYPPSYVVINPSSSAGATLQLNGATALSGLSSAGTNHITFNNMYATVNYAGASQTVYTNTAANVSGGISYYNLTATGSATKTVAGGTLTVSNNLVLAPASSALTFDLNFNSTVSAIGNFTSNTLSTLTQGSGKNFVVTGTATNNGIINLVGISTMFFNGGTGLINTGTVNQLAAGTISAAGPVTNSGTINKSYGLFLATTGYTNSTGGVFNGTTIAGTGGYTYITGAYLNNGTLTCNAETIYFGGNYTNNNIFTAGTGMVYFSASAPTLADNSTPGTLFNNVTFNGSGTATMVSGTGNFGVSPIGSLYMVSPANLIAGTSTVGGAAYLTLMSGASSTATAYTSPGATITGNVNVQRYITSGAGSRGYRLLCSPVNVSLNTSGAGNLSLSYLNANASFGGTTYYGAFTAGPGTGFTTDGSANPIIYLYDESRPTDNSSFVSGKNVGIYTISGSSVTTIGGVPAATTTGVSIPVGNSYLLYFVGSNQSTIVSSSRIPDATTLTATGYLNQGNVTVKFWKTNTTTIPYDVTTGTTNYGLNQIGNPYASTISLNTLYSDNYNATTNPIGNAFYELIPGGNYVTYNASNGHVSDTRASQYIVSGQGFLIQATGSSPAETITFKEDQKVAYNTSATLLESIPSGPALADAHMVNSLPIGNKVKNDALIAPQTVTTANNNAGLHLQLAKDTGDYAQTGIYFSSNAADTYVKSEDAAELDGGTPLVYLSSYSSDSVKLSINNMSAYGLSKRISLYDNATTNGLYTFSLYDMTGMDTTNYNIYLVDNLQKDSLDLVHYKTYSCNLNPADTNSVGSSRFVLAIDHKPAPKYELAAFWGQKMSAGVQLNWTAVNAGTYTGYTLQKLNANGYYDSLYTVQSDTTITTYNYIDTHPIIGNNVYRLKQNGMTGAISYSAAITVGYNSTAPAGALTLYPNPAKNTMSVSLASSTINTPGYLADIYSSTGKLIRHESVNAATWSEDISAYQTGIYVLQIKDTNGNIIGQSKFLKIN